MTKDNDPPLSGSHMNNDVLSDRSSDEPLLSWKIQDTSPADRPWSVQRLLSAPWAVGKELFLPIGFPSSVREGYLEYQLYDSLQGLCSYLRGVLCSAQVLQAAGVGDESATAWGAALTWALKDGLGMIGGLVFSYMASPLFDAHVKEFRLFADLINDVALTLDMLAPYCGSLLLVSSASTLCKTLCGMSAAATKANITVYFAIEGNMADLNAKESTQETLVSLLGMLSGVTLARWLQLYEKSHPDWTEFIQWSTFIALTLVHVWANWLGVCILRLPSLNRERAELVLSHLTCLDPNASMDDYLQATLPAPLQVNESLIVSTRKMLFPGKLNLQGDLRAMMEQDEPSQRYLNWFVKHQKYVVSVNSRRGRVQVCLLDGATASDELQAFCHALMLLRYLERQAKPVDSNWEAVSLCYGRLIHGWFRPENDGDSLPSRLSVLGWDATGRLYLGFSRKRTVLVYKED